MATVQIDTREKQLAIKNILSFFDAAHVNYISSKLFVGDYMLLENPLFIIDRKQNIAEIAANATSQHGRVKRELDRLKKMGGQMVFLIEQVHYVDPKGQHRTCHSIEDIQFWENPHGTVDGLQVYKILDAWQHKYNVSFQFCDKRSTGKRILEILSDGWDAMRKAAQYEQATD